MTLQINPKDKNAIMNIGYCFQLKGNKKKAQEYFNKARSI